MAILTQPKTTSRIKIEGLVPKGIYIGTCIDVEDAFGVQRPRYDDPNTMETVDLTWFYFGFKNKAGEMFIIKSKPFKLSLHEKSALYQFLKAWRAEAPQAGFDTESMRGAGAQITVEHGTSSKGKIYANIGSITPVMDGLEGKILPVETFRGYLEPQGGAVVQPQALPAALPIEGLESDEIPF